MYEPTLLRVAAYSTICPGKSPNRPTLFSQLEAVHVNKQHVTKGAI